MPAIYLLQKEYVSSGLSPLINSRNALTSDQCSSLDNTVHPVHLMVMDETTDGFIGCYDPDPNDVMALFDINLKVPLSGIAVNDSSTTYTGRRRLLSTGTFNGTTFSGVKNPIVCLENGEFMLFAVNNNNYPIYDV